MSSGVPTGAVGLSLPSRAADWRRMARTVRLVVTIPRYGALAALAGAGSLTVFALSQNIPLAQFALAGPLEPAARLEVLLGLYPFLGTVFSPAVSAVLVVVAALVGLDVALVTYHLRRFGGSARSSGGSAVGVALGVLGAGCAACGTVLLAGLLSLVGAAGALTLLPLEGLEFSLVAAGALVLSLHWVTEGMRGGEVNGCPVELPGR